MDEKQFLKIMENMTFTSKEEGISEIPFDLSGTDEKTINPMETASILKQYFDLFRIENQFQEGQCVIWKKGLKNRKYPRYDEPAIIIKVLDEPVFSSETDSGSPYFREPLNIVLGVMINNNLDFFYYDQRRFCPFTINDNDCENAKKMLNGDQSE